MGSPRLTSAGPSPERRVPPHRLSYHGTPVRDYSRNWQVPGGEDVANKTDEAHGKGKAEPAAAPPKPSRPTTPPIVESSAPAPVDEATGAAQQASGAPQPQAAAQQQTTISTSRGFVDFLATNRLNRPDVLPDRAA